MNQQAKPYKILKFSLQAGTYSDLELPDGSRFLSLLLLDGVPVLYAECPADSLEDGRTEFWRIAKYSTGEVVFPNPADVRQFLGTLYVGELSGVHHFYRIETAL